MPCQLIQPVPTKWYRLGYSIIGIGNSISALVTSLIRSLYHISFALQCTGSKLCTK